MVERGLDGLVFDRGDLGDRAAGGVAGADVLVELHCSWVAEGAGGEEVAPWFDGRRGCFGLSILEGSVPGKGRLSELAKAIDQAAIRRDQRDVTEEHVLRRLYLRKVVATQLKLGRGLGEFRPRSGELHLIAVGVARVNLHKNRPWICHEAIEPDEQIVDALGDEVVRLSQPEYILGGLIGVESG